MLERVRAMLAKAESTTYPAEAEAFTAAAQSLMARHSIDAAVLAATARGAAGAAPGAGPACTRIGVEGPYESAKALLLQVVAEANRCSAVWSSAHGSSTVVGFPTDLRAVEVLFTSLLVQATAHLAALGTASGAGPRSRSADFRRSYLAAYATRIGERLQAAADEETRRAVDASSGSSGPGAALLPVLASRAGAVTAELARVAPHVVDARTGTGSDPVGWASGRAAADLASLRPGAALPA